MTNSDLSLGPVLFMNEQACFLWQCSLFKHTLWCISVLEFISMAPGCLPAFCCYFLVCKMYYLDCISSIRSLRGWNFHTPQRFLCSETSLKCIFLSVFLCTIGLGHKNTICMKIRGKGQEYPQGKHSSIIYINPHKHFTVVCSFWLVQISPMRFIDVRFGSLVTSGPPVISEHL